MKTAARVTEYQLGYYKKVGSRKVWMPTREFLSIQEALATKTWIENRTRPVVWEIKQITR